MKVRVFQKSEYVLSIELFSDIGSMLLHTLLLCLCSVREVLGHSIEHETIFIMLTDVLENFMLLFLLIRKSTSFVKCQIKKITVCDSVTVR